MVSVNQQTLLGGARLNSIVDEQYPAPVGPVVDLSWFIMGYHGLSLFIMVYHGLSHYVPCFIITIHSLAVGIAVKKKSGSIGCQCGYMYTHYYWSTTI